MALTLVQTLQMERNFNFLLCENMKKRLGYFSKIAEVFSTARAISLYLGFKIATEINLATRKDCWFFKSKALVISLVPYINRPVT